MGLYHGDMNLRQIEIFRAVMETASFTAAAQMLHISQPGISRAVRHMETQLGVALFERKLGRIRPTQEATALHAEVERTYRGVLSIRQFAQGLRSGVHTMLRVVSSPSLGLEVVPNAVAALLARHANATLSLEVMPRAAQTVDALVSRQADVGISAVILDHPMLESRVLGQWELVCIFPQGHALEAKRKLTPRDLDGQPLIAFHADTLQGRIINQWIEGDLAGAAARVLVRSGQAAASLVTSGAGVAFVDDLTARAYERQGVRWRRVVKSPRFTAYAVWSVQQAPPRLAMELCDLVRKELKAVSN